MIPKIIYIVTQDLFGWSHKMAFTSLEEAEVCQESWWIEWGRRASKPTIHEQLVWDSFADYERYKELHKILREEKSDECTT